MPGKRDNVFVGRVLMRVAVADALRTGPNTQVGGLHAGRPTTHPSVGITALLQVLMTKEFPWETTVDPSRKSITT